MDDQGGGSDSLRTKLVTVYSFLASGVTITGLALAVLGQAQGLVGFVTAHLVITTLVVTLLMTLTTSLFNRMSYEGSRTGKVLVWIVNCVLCGVPLLPLGAWSLLKATLISLLLLVMLSLKSLVVPVSLTEALLSPLAAVHSVVLVCTGFSLLIGSMDNTVSWLVTSVCLHGGFLLYSALIICNSQRLRINARHPRFDPLFTAFVLYMNLINLFSRVAVFSSMGASPSQVPEKCS